MGRRSRVVEIRLNSRQMVLKLLSLFLEGKNIKEIAYMVGCSYDWCRRIIMRGLYLRGLHHSSIILAKKERKN